MSITMQYNISQALENLAMATTAEKDVLSQMTKTTNIKQTSKILTDQVKELTATNAHLISNGEQHKKFSAQATTCSKYKSNLSHIWGEAWSKILLRYSWSICLESSNTSNCGGRLLSSFSWAGNCHILSFLGFRIILCITCFCLVSTFLRKNYLMSPVWISSRYLTF